MNREQLFDKFLELVGEDKEAKVDKFKKDNVKKNDYVRKDTVRKKQK
jgi:hypothetical protein